MNKDIDGVSLLKQSVDTVDTYHDNAIGLRDMKWGYGFWQIVGERSGVRLLLSLARRSRTRKWPAGSHGGTTGRRITYDLGVPYFPSVGNSG